MEESHKTIEELERKIRRLSSPVEQNANKMAREVVQALIAFLNGGGELPQGLLLSMGTKLIDHLADGEQMARDIQILYNLIEKALANISMEETLKSVDQ